MFKSFEWSYHTDRHQYYNDFSTRNDLYAFVERVNELLEEPARFPVRSDGALSTELRILAVMRLGITDSGCIASFLNCASATVYTYRTKLRNSALGSRSDFENRVRRIGL